MSPMETALLLFFDSFMAAILLPVHRMYVLTSMLLFGPPFPPAILALLAIAGGTLGGLVNVALGRIFISVSKVQQTVFSERENTRWFQLIQRYAWAPVLLLGWYGMAGGILMLAAGFVKARFVPVALAVLGSMAGYYGWVVVR